MFKFLCKIGIHENLLCPSYVRTIEDGKVKLWVVLICRRCKTFKKIGMAHESEDTNKISATDLGEFKFRN